MAAVNSPKIVKIGAQPSVSKTEGGSAPSVPLAQEFKIVTVKKPDGTLVKVRRPVHKPSPVEKVHPTPKSQEKEKKPDVVVVTTAIPAKPAVKAIVKQQHDKAQPVLLVGPAKSSISKTTQKPAGSVQVPASKAQTTQPPPSAPPLVVQIQMASTDKPARPAPAAAPLDKAAPAPPPAQKKVEAPTPPATGVIGGLTAASTTIEALGKSIETVQNSTAVFAKSTGIVQAAADAAPAAAPAQVARATTTAAGAKTLRAAQPAARSDQPCASSGPTAGHMQAADVDQRAARAEPISSPAVTTNLDEESDTKNSVPEAGAAMGEFEDGDVVVEEGDEVLEEGDAVFEEGDEMLEEGDEVLEEGDEVIEGDMLELEEGDEPLEEADVLEEGDEVLEEGDEVLEEGEDELAAEEGYEDGVDELEDDVDEIDEFEAAQEE